MVDLATLEPDASPVDLWERLRQVSRTGPNAPPWTLANMVASLDGRAALNGRSGKLGGPVDRIMFQAIRALADVVLVGAATVRTERYGPIRLSEELQAARRRVGMEPTPVLAVVSRTLRLPPDTGLLDVPDRLVLLTGPEAPPELRIDGGKP